MPLQTNELERNADSIKRHFALALKLQPTSTTRKPLRVAITGATGFAGRPILQAVLAQGHIVSTLVRSPQTQIFPPAVTIVKGGLSDPQSLQTLVQGVDAVVHVAGAISAVNRNEFFAVNATGTHNMMAAARAAGVKRFIHISSLAARHPHLSHYAASKATAEQEVQSTNGSMATLILRPAAIYGPGDRATLPLLQQLMRPTAILPGRETNKFSLLHVDDFAAIVATTLTQPTTGLREIDDTQGGHSWPAIANMLQPLFGKPKRVIYLPQLLAMAIARVADLAGSVKGSSTMISTGKMREMYHPDWVASGPGWPRPDPVLLRDGLQKTINWYIEAGWIKAAPTGTNQ